MNRMLLLALVAISLIKTSQCVKATPGQPVPHADVLDDLLSKFLGDSYSNNALFDYILGQPSQDRDNLTGDNLDISILDVKNVQKIIAFAKKKHNYGMMAPENSRRAPYVAYPNDVAYQWHPYVVNKTLDLMKQTIYMTKEKINLTRPFRQKYNGEFSYQIAILYGAAAAILGKMEALYNQMKHFLWRTHFIWYLIIYEKMLACNIDIADSIEKIFIIQDKYEEIRGPKGPKLSDGVKVGNLSRGQVNEMMINRLRAAEHQKFLNERQKRFNRK